MGQPRGQITAAQPLLFCAGVLVAHAGAIDAMYYLRSVKRHPIADSDLVVFLLPTLLALTAHVVALGARPRQTHELSLAGRIFGSVIMTFLGLWIGMVGALNTWGA
jgi:hypothetical protein